MDKHKQKKRKTEQKKKKKIKQRDKKMIDGSTRQKYDEWIKKSLLEIKLIWQANERHLKETYRRNKPLET